jgi:hypothetical protein
MVKSIVHATMTFGRFQPVTQSHEDMFCYINEKCFRDESQDYIFISPSVDNKTNPLTLKFRYDFLSKIFQAMTFVAYPHIKSPFDALCELGKFGFNHIDIIVGPDRVEKFCNFKRYVHHPDPLKTIPGVDRIEVIPFVPQLRLKDIRATQARKAVVDQNFNAFCKVIPECNLEYQIQLYRYIGKGLGLNEATTRITT